MKELEKYFDHYTINARFMPAFFSLLPFVLTMLAWCPMSKSLLGGALTILISFGVMTFISSLISNLGNKCQKKLFLTWRGAPTTAILRHTDQVLDKYTKQRYHKWLDDRIGGLNLPEVEDEVHDQADADLKYQSAINYLREFTRDKGKYPAVYRDNVAYGFARNLLATRKFGLLVSVISLSINLYLILLGFDLDLFKSNALITEDHIFGIGAGLASATFLGAYLFIVNSQFVKERGFRYAKSLLESCEIH
ncbi:MAG: hypothetical protein AB2806_22925 [Candidatus Thiodiazotropha sp.]